MTTDMPVQQCCKAPEMPASSSSWEACHRAHQNGQQAKGLAWTVARSVPTATSTNVSCAAGLPCKHVLPACQNPRLSMAVHVNGCRCLCLPVVLYETAKQASDYDVDVFGVLRRCRHQYPHFQTQWAAAIPTACPTMLVKGDLLDRLARMGSATILSGGTPTWAWSNLLQAKQFAEQHPAGSQAMTELAEYVLGRMLSVCIMVSLLCATLLFFLVHNFVMLKTSRVYQVSPVLRCCYLHV